MRLGVIFNRRFLSAPALLVGLVLALALPGVAQAHHDPAIVFQGVTATTTPTIDGALGAGEWTDTPSYPVTFGDLSGTVMFKHDAQYLYVALTVSDGDVGSKSTSFFFDDDHDGLKDAGEDAILAFVGEGNTGGDFYWSPTGDIGGASHYGDTSNAPGTTPPGNGTADISAGGTEFSGQVTFELRHPLCSTDDTHDFCLANGDTAGVLLQYQSGGPFWRYPGASPTDPERLGGSAHLGGARGHRPHRLRVEPRRRSRDLLDEPRRLVGDSADRERDHGQPAVDLARRHAGCLYE